MHFKRKDGQEIDGKGCGGISWPPCRLEAGRQFFFFLLAIPCPGATAEVQIAHDVAAVNWQSSGSGTTDPDDGSKQ